MIVKAKIIVLILFLMFFYSCLFYVEFRAAEDLPVRIMDLGRHHEPMFVLNQVN